MSSQSFALVAPSCQSPTRSEFVNAVSEFKEKYKVKLSDFLVGNCAKDLTKEQINQREEFMLNRTIRQYLCRN